MASKRKGLGRGLDALLGTIGADPGSNTAVIDAPTNTGSGSGSGNRSGDENHTAIDSPATVSGGVSDTLLELPIEKLRPGRYQPRMAMRPEGLEELAESIRSQGILQPILARPVGDGEYEIIAGERRWRAAQLAELDSVPILVRDVPDSAALAISLIENIQREDLNPIEEASALQKLIDEFDMTHQEVGTALGRSRTGITNLLRLLTLTPEVRVLLENGDIEMGHARALLTLDRSDQIHAGHTVANRGLSVRETEELVRQMLAPPAKPSTGPIQDPNIRILQDDLAERLGARVMLQHGAKGKGKLVVHYNSLDELDGILAHIK